MTTDTLTNPAKLTDEAEAMFARRDREGLRRLQRFSENYPPAVVDETAQHLIAWLRARLDAAGMAQEVEAVDRLMYFWRYLAMCRGEFNIGLATAPNGYVEAELADELVDALGFTLKAVIERGQFHAWA